MVTQAATASQPNPDIKIDLNRGVTYKKHNKGIQVYMYKDDPGRFYDASGNIVSDSFAKTAGFDTRKLKAKGDIQRKINDLGGQLKKEYDSLDQRAVLYENSGYKVLEASAKFADIIDESGKVMNVTPLLKKEAIDMLKSMTEDSNDSDET